ncbi:polymer-forming cytoskeletal protein [Halosimplex aquaticum]|uniref:Polymer-forming cytoskeletal protein n=1 Tax=Halosimplex aquaticum TaxID=3026162 RepID=A0ABD5Y3M8_9EURY|nr:polymer-forming cytoskeletal protein [Halosimplex aquaticum]
MSPTEAIPLLIVVLLLVGVGGGDAEQMTVTFQGDHTLQSLQDVHVVAGGTVSVPADATVSGDLYVIGGTTRVEGQLDGDVTVLAGNLTVVEAATVTGTVQTISGESAIADGASVGQVSAVDPPAPSNSPIRRIAGFLLQFLVVGFAGWWFGRRHSTLLDNIGHSITEHALVSGVVGALAAATLLVLFVYMAFTLLLIPLSIAGLVGEVLIVLYSQVAFGRLVGRQLPIDRDEVATVAGVGLFLLALELLALVPYLGTLVQFALIVVGFGAVLNSYFGLQRFEPVTIPDGTGR